MKQTIEKFRPIVQCELSNNYTYPRYGYKCDEINDYFIDLKYSYCYINKNNALYEFEGVNKSSNDFGKDLSNGYEFFFIPKESFEAINCKSKFDKKIKVPYAV